jgi:phosphate starvation-inducible PhoH-like protein
MSQLKLFMTRFGQNSKIIITGDPKQSDIGSDSALMPVVKKLEELQGIGVIHFKSSSIVRHPLIASILEKLEDQPK